MIRDPQAKLEIARDWVVVRKLCEGSHLQWQSENGSVINESRPDDSYNLPLVLAYCVLDTCLDELVAQGVFSCATWKLKPKMEASRGPLTWKDYHLVDTGRDRRNDLAHRAKLETKADCLRYVQAVEDELKGWGIL
jgi:hypothetical protein